MSLSPQDKIEFERLTADLEFDSPDLKKMAKRERATTMSYVALPGIGARFTANITTIMMVLAFIVAPVVIVFLLAHDPFAAMMAGYFGMVAYWGVYTRRALKSLNAGTGE